MKTIYEDDQYKILYGSSNKGCMSARGNDSKKLIVIDKLLGQQIPSSDLPTELLKDIQEQLPNGNT